MSCNLTNIPKSYSHFNDRRQDINNDPEIIARKKIIESSEEIIKITKEQITDINKVIDLTIQEISLTEQIIANNEKIIFNNNIIIENNKKECVLLKEYCENLEALIKLEELNKVSSKITIETIISKKTQQISYEDFEKVRQEIYGQADYEKMKQGTYFAGSIETSILLNKKEDTKQQNHNFDIKLLLNNSYLNAKNYLNMFKWF